MVMNYSITLEDAKKRFENTRSFDDDPLPAIPPSLLNTAHIKLYVEKTGMVYPFNEADCKSATFKGKVGGEYQYWDETDREPRKCTLSQHNDFVELRPNSITFVPIELHFHLPDYIAVRFNLKIDHVYRGLLCGTGPIIDPGYKGKIWVPVHNLTTNKYKIFYGETLVWFEFTKTTKPTGSETQLFKRYKKELANSPEPTLTAFLNEALGTTNQIVLSSIPDAIAASRKAAENAQDEVKRIRNLGGAAILLTVLLGLVPVYLDTINELRSVRLAIADLRRENDRLSSALTTARQAATESSVVLEQSNAMIEDGLSRIAALEERFISETDDGADE